MNNHLKKFIVPLIVIWLLLVPLITQAVKMSDIISDLDITAQNAKIVAPGQEPKNVFQITGSIINLFLTAMGVVFLIMMIYGGIMWMTAAGNDERVKKAKTLISQAGMGILILLASYLLVNFIMFRLIETATTVPTAATPSVTASCSQYTDETSCNADTHCDWITAAPFVCEPTTDSCEQRYASSDCTFSSTVPGCLSGCAVDNNQCVCLP